jgi:hypothetical protein
MNSPTTRRQPTTNPEDDAPTRTPVGNMRRTKEQPVAAGNTRQIADERGKDGEHPSWQRHCVSGQSRERTDEQR